MRKRLERFRAGFTCQIWHSECVKMGQIGQKSNLKRGELSGHPKYLERWYRKISNFFRKRRAPGNFSFLWGYEPSDLSISPSDALRTEWHITRWCTGPYTGFRCERSFIYRWDKECWKRLLWKWLWPGMSWHRPLKLSNVPWEATSAGVLPWIYAMWPTTANTTKPANRLVQQLTREITKASLRESNSFVFLRVIS